MDTPRKTTADETKVVSDIVTKLINICNETEEKNLFLIAMSYVLAAVGDGEGYSDEEMMTGLAQAIEGNRADPAIDMEIISEAKH